MKAETILAEFLEHYCPGS